jgi:hypothetical protein
VEDLFHPGPRRARQRDLKGQPQFLADWRRRVLRHGRLWSPHQSDLLGFGQSGCSLRFEFSSGRQPLHQQRNSLRCDERQDHAALPVHAERQHDYDEIGSHILIDTKASGMDSIDQTLLQQPLAVRLNVDHRHRPAELEL